MTVRRLLDELDSRELSEWLAYEQYAGTLGPGRLDTLAAITASAAANSNPRRTRQRQMTTAAEFMPRWGGKPRQTWQDQLAVVTSLTRSLGGTVVEEA